MARFLFLCLCICAAFTGCTSGTGPEKVPPRDIHHLANTSWTWLRTLGHFSIGPVTPAAAGFTARLNFRADSVCRLYQNGVLADSARYSVYRGVWFQTDSVYMIRLDRMSTGDSVVPYVGFWGSGMLFATSIVNDTLLMDAGMAVDNIANIYVPSK